MKESSTYQAIVEEGRLQAMRGTLLRQGRLRCGPPAESAQSTIQAINNLEKLEELTEWLLTASNWKELLRDITVGFSAEYWTSQTPAPFSATGSAY